MRAFASEIFDAMDVTLRFKGPPGDAAVPIAIEAGVRRQVFLIFKEAVNNAASHSGCRNVDVEMSVDDGSLTLRVADDGRGLPPAGNGDGHGLRSMAERARALGGSLEMRSEPGKGTSVMLKAPLRRGRARGRPHRNG
jgi:signal transduction histidine kinase